MERKIFIKGFLVSVLMLFSCGGGGGSTSEDPYINPYVKVVNGEIVQKSIATAGYLIDGTEIKYIAAFSLENGKLVYSTVPVDDNGNFQMYLKEKLEYSFVLFDVNMQPVLLIKENGNNVILVEGDAYIKVVVDMASDGRLVVVDIEHDDNCFLERNELYEDYDDDNIPDFAEEDHDNDGYPDYDEDGDGYFDGIEDNDGDGVVDGAEDTDNDHLPDPIDDDDDDDGIPDDEDNDDDNDGIPDDEDDD